jgi:hypothetical protein
MLCRPCHLGIAYVTRGKCQHPEFTSGAFLFIPSEFHRIWVECESWGERGSIRRLTVSRIQGLPATMLVVNNNVNTDLFIVLSQSWALSELPRISLTTENF